MFSRHFLSIPSLFSFFLTAIILTSAANAQDMGDESDMNESPDPTITLEGEVGAVEVSDQTIMIEGDAGEVEIQDQTLTIAEGYHPSPFPRRFNPRAKYRSVTSFLRLAFEEASGSQRVVNRHRMSSRLRSVGYAGFGTSRVDGVFGENAMRFNGPTAVVSFDNVGLNKNQMTFSSWIRFDEARSSTLVSLAKKHVPTRITHRSSYSSMGTMPEEAPMPEEMMEDTEMEADAMEATVETTGVTVAITAPAMEDSAMDEEEPMAEEMMEDDMAEEMPDSVEIESAMDEEVLISHGQDELRFRIVADEESSPRLMFAMSINGEAVELLTEPLEQLSEDEWHHLGARVFNGRLDIFLNGENVASGEIPVERFNLRSRFRRNSYNLTVAGRTAMINYRINPCFTNGVGLVACLDSAPAMVESTDMNDVPVNAISPIFAPFEDLFMGDMDEVRLESRARGDQFFMRHYQRGMMKLEEGAGSTCSRELIPVCGLDADGMEQTFDNLCLAEAAGATSITEGECEESPAICTEEFAPVCGLNEQNVRETYPNLCEAERAGAMDITEGECEPLSSGCTTEFAPVCGSIGEGEIPQTFPNLCQAERAGALEITEGECEELPVVCTMEFVPVCGLNDEGVRETYSNLCMAEGDGATEITEGECEPLPSACMTEFVPVCGTVGDSEVRATFTNLCEAERAMASDITEGECSTESCMDDGTLVCAVTIQDHLITFASQCQAESAGAIVVDTEACGVDVDVCITSGYRPVCAISLHGVEQTYTNGCYSEIVGATIVSEEACVDSSNGTIMAGDAVVQF